MQSNLEPKNNVVSFSSLSCAYNIHHDRILTLTWCILYISFFYMQLSYAHPYKARYINAYTQNVYSERYAHQREALIARAQRINTAREYRARARTAVRRPSA